MDDDEDCDADDYAIAATAIGHCEKEGYNALADADHDGCVTIDDLKQLFPNLAISPPLN